MNDAESMNQSSYRKAFRYLKSSVSQSSLTTRFYGSPRDVDLEAVKVVSKSTPQLVFFPSYARSVSRPEQEVIVNVHGWISNPAATDRPSRRNKYTMLLARSLAGLPALPVGPELIDQTDSSSSRPTTASTDVSLATSDSKTDFDTSDMSDSAYSPKRAATFDTAGGIIRSSSMKRQESSDSQKFTRHYSDHDLVTCHANLTSRISPFLAKPVPDLVVQCNITSEGKSIKTAKMVTGENGHFRGTVRIPQSQLSIEQLSKLEARIEEDGISGSTEIHFVTDSGVSVISDMDDTVKHTNILAGMREAFRNAFVRDLPTLQIDGVRTWYESMKAMGCNVHYVSNAPYQLWPCLASFIRVAGLPSGTIHLKQYSGFLQGMFEPAAEKKRANVEKILMDFPDRKFLLIGDSGEQDLELYSELARSEYSKQILGIFIRDVSTVQSALSTPTGESGEEFFSKNRGDDVVDTGTGVKALPSVTEVASPPRLPARRTEASLIDMTPLQTSSKDVKSANSNMAHWADMLSLDSPSGDPVHGIDSSAAKRDMPSSQIVSDKVDSIGRPTLPRKPTNLKFWTKGLDVEPPSVPTSAACKGKSDLQNSRPGLSRTGSSNSVNGALTTSRRPGMLRTLSANSSTYYGEGRRMSKAQERTHAWEVRLAKARAMLPKRIKLYTWREGADCQEHAEELIRAAMKQ